MITAELTRKIDLLPQESYDRVENFVEQLLMINTQNKKEKAFKLFMEKMDMAEKSVQEYGYITEDEAEKELEKV